MLAGKYKNEGGTTKDLRLSSLVWEERRFYCPHIFFFVRNKEMSVDMNSAVQPNTAQTRTENYSQEASLFRRAANRQHSPGQLPGRRFATG